ncbi:hypothetical protein HPB51_014861 [Rhipicephalus microplus]|uniref:Exonuclease domain-containing protein n=1 Tax=Rhipicephalus microplus TaxID=6941 RepID=A0A9J6DNJ5_RHIMP|nr:hypothetical protein HPB51_014861 [Rhipicephalus microplus]
MDLRQGCSQGTVSSTVPRTSTRKCHKDTGTQSGLTEACRKSHLTLKEAEDQLCSYVGGLVTPGQCPLAGSTVYMDRRFLQRDMPRLDSLLHYRIVDVSTVKELAR